MDISAFDTLCGVPFLNCQKDYCKFADPFRIIIVTKTQESKCMVAVVNKRDSMITNLTRYT